MAKSYGYEVYSHPWQLACQEIKDKNSGDCVYIDEDFTLEISLMDLISFTLESMRQISKVVSWGQTNSEYHLEFENGSGSGLIRVSCNDGGSPIAKQRSIFTFSICGEKELALAILVALQNRFGSEKLASVTWWLMQSGQAQKRSIVLEIPKPTYREFYPWIQEDINEYFDRYLASDASILFMLGKAGTGKTTLIRHFLYQKKLSAIITYEDHLLTTDEMFVEFMTSRKDNVLVVEDADLMLGSREHAGNKMISRFLNISDGLVKFHGKKIIFTTNLDDFKDVDQALIRPGRCFDALSFRPLSYAESVEAAKVAGLPAPTTREERTLAQLFNQDTGSVLARHKVGF